MGYAVKLQRGDAKIWAKFSVRNNPNSQQSLGPTNWCFATNGMEKINVYNISLDRCVADGGIWFDGEELPKILNIIAHKSNLDRTSLEKYLNELCINKK